ncbi:pumilio 12-like protein [Cinnamomum micranthum f. kanehirae]|uniref:Pumilio 12-like protein n=1 Tax=Cinnamomum micranthum f. kanehirae TaxID=337451 RepID=A0A443NHM1_9MAGN|nr:pumilio 12-like protein [Cinnamomum micranthum f. kanehirae]
MKMERTWDAEEVVERAWDEEEELQRLPIPFPISNSSPFPCNYSSQANIHNPFFLETALSRMTLNASNIVPLYCPHPQSPSPFVDVVQSPLLQSPTVPTVYCACTSPSYNNHIQQTTLKLRHQTCLHNFHTYEPTSAKAHYSTLSQSHPYEKISYKNDLDSFTRLHQHCCCLQSTNVSSSSSAGMTLECNKKSSTRGCLNTNKFRPHADRHHGEGPVLELDNSSMSRSQYQPHNLLPTITRYSALEDLRGRMAAEAMDQNGCQFLQKKVEEGRKEDINMIFLELKDHLCDLMVDSFGNHLVQKLIEVCTEEQRTEAILSATRNEFKLFCTCLDIYGTRAMKKLLEHLTTAQQICCVISALKPNTIKLSKNINGCHVMEHCFRQFSSDYNKPLSIKIADHCVEVATNRNGCCVLQKCVENAQGEQKERLMLEIVANALFLAQHEYGNYVVQFLVGLNLPHVTTNVLRQLEGNFVHLSVQKCSSNVVERCLNEANQEEVTWIIRELLGSPNPLSLLQGAYGNYVIQSALAVAKVSFSNQSHCSHA